jgi:hypothetical protein
VSIANGTTASVYCDGTEFYFSVPPYAITNTASTLVYRDGSGNFAAGTITATAVAASLSASTGLPISTGVSGLGTGVATFLATPSSANLAAALTDETGSGAAVFANSPTLVTPALGTPSALVGTNITGTAAGLSIGGNLTGASPTAATQSAGTNNTTVATTAFTTTAISNALQVVYPVGSIYTSTVSTNPNTLFGFGTWVAFGAGRVMIGNGGGFSAGATGGSADAVVVSHTHTATSSVTDPGHLHTMSPNADGYSAGNTSNSVRGPGGGAYAFSTQSATTGITVGTSITSAGVSGTNANLQPYVVVYMWNRTA